MERRDGGNAGGEAFGLLIGCAWNRNQGLFLALPFQPGARVVSNTTGEWT